MRSALWRLWTVATVAALTLLLGLFLLLDAGNDSAIPYSQETSIEGTAFFAENATVQTAACHDVPHAALATAIVFRTAAFVPALRGGCGPGGYSLSVEVIDPSGSHFVLSLSDAGSSIWPLTALSPTHSVGIQWILEPYQLRLLVQDVPVSVAIEGAGGALVASPLVIALVTHIRSRGRPTASGSASVPI